MRDKVLFEVDTVDEEDVVLALPRVWLCANVDSECVAFVMSCVFALKIVPMISEAPSNVTRVGTEISSILFSASRRVVPKPDGLFDIIELHFFYAYPDFTIIVPVIQG